MMEACKYNALLSLSLFLFLFLLWCARFADAQTEVLSIYCGSERNYSDAETNITWDSDDGHYIDNIGKKFDGVRVFPRPLNKSCYEFRFTPNLPHLLRLSFSLPPSSAEIGAFNYSVETSDMLYMEKVEFDYPYFSENILVSADSLLHICLIRNSECHDPSISTIELRPLEPGMYGTAKQGTMLHTEERCDVGTEKRTRYPEDPYDRLWNYIGCDYNSFSENNTLYASNSISMDNTKNKPPSTVMQTAFVTNAGDDNIYFYLQESTSQYAVVVLYFAQLNSTVKRSFSVEIDDVIRVKRIDLVGNFSATEREFQYKGGGGAIVWLESINDRSPIINAYESYSIFHTQPPTFHHDVKALGELKKSLSLNNWISDPCFGFAWEGINCSKIGNTSIRISQIDLSGKKLGGSIPPSFGQLTELVSLSLNDNNFNGTLPNLTSLFKLERLYLQNNHLFGKIRNWLDNLTYF